MKSLLRSLFVCAFASLFLAQDASAQSTPPKSATMAQLQTQIRQIDAELKGTRVLVRRAFLSRNDVYQTVLPTPARRATLLAQRETLESRLAVRRTMMMKGLTIGLMIGMMNSEPLFRDEHPVVRKGINDQLLQGMIQDLRRMNYDAMNRR